MRVRIRHETRYRYDEPALLGPHVVRLRPAEHLRAKLLTYNLSVSPKSEQRWQQDPWGNRIVRLSFPAGEATPELVLAVDLALDIRPVNPFDFFIDDGSKELPFAYPDALRRELAPFLGTPTLGSRTRDFVASIPAKGYPTDWLVALNQQVAKTVKYIIRNEIGLQTSEETLTVGSGSCRDSAVLLVDALRANGLAARFVSGYLVQLADEGNIPDVAKGVSMDVVDLHAWAEVFIPGAGWVGLDGTSGLLCGEGHIPLAGTVNPELASPVEGTASQLGRIEFSMGVQRLGHEPSPRRPYTDAQWESLRVAGTRIDEVLGAAGVRLTMGGEPTFTSREHAGKPEWLTEALGPTKWQHGMRLSTELMKRLGTGTLAMHRMGKHYPGESLPRWAMHLMWRPDGEPIWCDASRLDFASGGHASVQIKRMTAGATVGDAQRFAQAVARRLALKLTQPGHEGSSPLVPGYEDPWLHIMQEMNLPLDVDPLDADLDDPETRRTLARVLSQGLGRAVGFALPLGRLDARWITSPWTFRRGHMFLIPGDSPMGLRLPLDRLDGTPLALWARDTSVFEKPPVLPPRIQLQNEPRPDDTPPGGMPGPSMLSTRGQVRTALCFEPRGGVLHVFLPPMPTLEDFLTLVAVLEDTCVETQLKISLEGYPPPGDPRLRSCLVTPDPGVLEVNVPVTERSEDFVALHETLAEAALHAGLTTEKYQLDGREVGSGGGHHLTLGGPYTLASPFLQRPELLGGLLRYIQNHPSLSYLFTGLFVGPTSQAPRLDEARHDALYELEIALSRLPRPGEPQVAPWVTDRLFRNLLADVAGNTHRTEICIDKLYDPQSAAGRQGIVEFRAFEMPPHERLAVAQMLLVRGLVAMLAHTPYERPLVRWGSELHDRFMLPHFVWRDFEGVLSDLRAAGVPLDVEHFVPFFDHKFPLLGQATYEDVTIELRSALEAWPVLGEEQTASGTSRYVDSSLERVQVRVDGLTEGRQLVLVNGVQVPLRPTGRASERVAGVRFRAWHPPHSLQPTIGVHHPLRFDVIDTWAQRSLGAVTYHVVHPDGRGYDEPPLTAFEAAARRAQRFTTRGHAPWPVVPVRAPVHPEQPFTLDLRHVGGDRRIIAE